MAGRIQYATKHDHGTEVSYCAFRSVVEDQLMRIARVVFVVLCMFLPKEAWVSDSVQGSAISEDKLFIIQYGDPMRRDYVDPEKSDREFKLRGIPNIAQAEKILRNLMPFTQKLKTRYAKNLYSLEETDYSLNAFEQERIDHYAKMSEDPEYGRKACQVDFKLKEESLGRNELIFSLAFVKLPGLDELLALKKEVMQELKTALNAK